MGKVYREFSRQKYNKYKAQFPRLRESEIVSKIIKEWDSLDNVAKNNLQTIYEKKNYLTNEDISSSEALAKADLASKEARFAAERASRKVSKTSFTKLHSNVKPSSRDGSDFNRGSEQKDDSRLGDSSSPQVLVQKTRPIIKASKEDYVSFYKYHYKKLKGEHKRWTTTQITSVIRLLWKKKKSTTKGRKVGGKLRTTKPISGRRHFRKVRRLSAHEATFLWKHMPIETRNYWSHDSLGREINNTKVGAGIPIKFAPGASGNLKAVLLRQ
mgnify:CR=1 FL=1